MSTNYPPGVTETILNRRFGPPHCEQCGREIPDEDEDVDLDHPRCQECRDNDHEKPPAKNLNKRGSQISVDIVLTQTRPRARLSHVAKSYNRPSGTRKLEREQTMKMNKTYRAARKACGECLGRLTTDDIYSKLSIDQLLEVQMDGFVGLDYQSYYNSFVPDMGMTREEVNRTSGYFTHIHQWGACVPTAVGPDWVGEVEPCSGEKDGFYWVTDGEKSLEDYIAEAEAAAEENEA